MAVASQQPTPTLQPGAQVKVHSLVGRPELNGRYGSVLTVDAVTGRAGVAVQGEAKAVSLKVSNLQEAPAAATCAPDAIKQALSAAGLTETMIADLLVLSAKLEPGMLEIAAGERRGELMPLLKAAGVNQLGLRQKATLALHSLASDTQAAAEACAGAAKAAAEKAVATKAMAQEALKSVAVGMVPPEGSVRDRNRREFRAFRPGEQVRFTVAVAATTVMQAAARGRQCRRPSDRARLAARATERPGSRGAQESEPAARAGHAEGAGEAAAAGAPVAMDSTDSEPAEPTPKDIAQACAVGLYDQMVSVGVAPAPLVPLRPILGKLTGLAYDGDTQGLMSALMAAGVTQPALLQKCGLAIMELTGAVSEAAADATAAEQAGAASPAPAVVQSEGVLV